MNVEVTLDTKNIQKALRLTDKQLQSLQKRAAKRTATNARAIASKGNLGIEALRRKKVPRARVKPINKGNEIGIWFGLNDVRASEFKDRPVQEKGGVRFRGKFYKDYFLARFKYDKLPKTIKRAVKLPEGKKSWVEVMVPIEREAREFIETEIAPQIGKLFQKNLGQAVDALPHIKVVR